jgi:uncharacterized membrane protein YgcG
MKNLKRILLLLSIIILTPSSYGFEVVSFTPNVVDIANLLSISEKQEINQEIDRLKKNADIYAAVYIFKSLDGDTIENAAIMTFDQWGLGRKKDDNGLLFIMAVQDRKMRLEIGQGLEGTLTDIKTKHILDRLVVPEFRNDNFVGGISLALIKSGEVHIGKSLNLPKESHFTGDKAFNDGLKYFIVWAILINGFFFLKIIKQKMEKGTFGKTLIFLPLFLTLNPGAFIAIGGSYLQAFIDTSTQTQLLDFFIHQPIGFLERKVFLMQDFNIWSLVILFLGGLNRNFSAFISKFKLVKIDKYSPLILREGSSWYSWLPFYRDPPLSTFKRLSINLFSILFLLILGAILTLTDFVYPFLILIMIKQMIHTAFILSPKLCWKWEARKKLNRIMNRAYGKRMIFGKEYNISRPSRSSSGSSFGSSSLSSRSSSSSGGSSSGGGSSSSW